MASNTRYIFTKRIYNNYIVLLKCKEGYSSFDIDNKILKYINFKRLSDLNKMQINYIIIENMDIIKHQKYKNNTFEIYKMKVLFTEIIDKLFSKII